MPVISAPVFYYSNGYPSGSLSDNPIIVTIEYQSGDPTGDTSNIPTDKPGSKTRSQPSSYPDALRQGGQEAQVSMQRYLKLFILHIISPFSSRQISTQTRWRGSLIISHIGEHKFYYGTHSLFSSTKLQIYDKEKCERVKVIIFYKSAMDSNIILLDLSKPKTGHSWMVQAQVLSIYA